MVMESNTTTHIKHVLNQLEVVPMDQQMAKEIDKVFDQVVS